MADSISDERFHRRDDVSFEVDDSKLHNVGSNNVVVRDVSFEIKQSAKENCFVSKSDIPR